MTHFNLFSASKNKWIEAREQKLRKEFQEREDELQSQYEEVLKNTKEFHESDLDKLNNQLDSIREEVRKKILELDHQAEMLKFREIELAELFKINEQKRVDLEKANQELREQIRLIEAKARPDAVWAEAFTMGVSKTFDMLPMLKESVEKAKESIKQEAIDSTIKNLEGVISSRIDKSGQVHIKAANKILAKREHFNKLLQITKLEPDKTKYASYISTLDWVLNGNVSEENKS